MEYYYNITIVRATRGDAEDVTLVLKEQLDCFDGDNRRKIVDYARARNLVKHEDLQWIRDVENMNKADYDELVAHNLEERNKMTPEKKEKIINHLFEHARGYGMAEGNGIQSAFDADGNYLPDRKGGTVEGGKLAFAKCINAIPEKYLEDFIYTLYRIADKSGDEGFDWI